MSENKQNHWKEGFSQLGLGFKDLGSTVGAGCATGWKATVAGTKATFQAASIYGEAVKSQYKMNQENQSK